MFIIDYKEGLNSHYGIMKNHNMGESPFVCAIACTEDKNEFLFYFDNML